MLKYRRYIDLHTYPYRVIFASGNNSTSSSSTLRYHGRGSDPTKPLILTSTPTSPPPHQSSSVHSASSRSGRSQSGWPQLTSAGASTVDFGRRKQVAAGKWRGSAHKTNFFLFRFRPAVFERKVGGKIGGDKFKLSRIQTISSPFFFVLAVAICSSQ